MNPDLYQELVKQINNLQKQVDALVKPEVGRWMDWTPTITQNGAVAADVTLAKYIISDNVIDAQVVLSVTGAGTAGQIIHIAGIPSAIAPTAGTILGTVLILDISLVLVYVGVVYANGVNDLIFYAHNSGAAMGTTPNFGLANGDVIYLNMMWKI